MRFKNNADTWFDNLDVKSFCTQCNVELVVGQGQRLRAQYRETWWNYDPRYAHYTRNSLSDGVDGESHPFCGTCSSKLSKIEAARPKLVKLHAEEVDLDGAA